MTGVPSSPTRVTNVAFGYGASADSSAGVLHPSTMQPRAFFCHACVQQYQQPPVEQLDAVSGRLLHRFCTRCRSELIEVIESTNQLEDAAEFSARSRAARSFVDNQPVVMRVQQQLPDGGVITQIMRVHVPVNRSPNSLGRAFHTALHPFYAPGDDEFEQVLNRLFHDAQSAVEGRGAPATVASLERLNWFEAHDDLEHACTVCMDQPQRGESCVELPCKHQFHAECVKPWFRAHNTCPTCRHQVE
jgi:hypothetical protein